MIELMTYLGSTRPWTINRTSVLRLLLATEPYHWFTKRETRRNPSGCLPVPAHMRKVRILVFAKHQPSYSSSRIVLQLIRVIAIAQYHFLYTEAGSQACS